MLRLAYTHVKGGNVIQGHLVRRECNSKIKIYSPVDRADRRAIVILQGAHNHPRFPATKLSRDGKDLYTQAVVETGVTGVTVVKVDSGMDSLM